LLEIEMEPVTAPADAGANVAVKEVVCPGLRLCGVSPVTLNPAPVTLPAVIERAAVPEFDRVTETDSLPPTARFAKGMLAGFAVSAPCVPVPLRAIDIVGSEAVVVIVMAPDPAPAAAGANWVVKDALAPAAMLCPAASPVALKPVPVVLT